MKKIIAVRWLLSGWTTYDSNDGQPYIGDSFWQRMVNSVRYELETSCYRERSFLYGTRNICESQFGLVVNQNESTIIAIYKRDAYTLLDGCQIVSQYRNNYDSHRSRKPVKVYHHMRVSQKYSWDCHWAQGMNEGIGLLKYDGMVVRTDASARVKKYVKALCKIIGLVYMGDFESLV